jgi:hypothetical protein
MTGSYAWVSPSVPLGFFDRYVINPDDSLPPPPISVKLPKFVSGRPVPLSGLITPLILEGNANLVVGDAPEVLFYARVWTPAVPTIVCSLDLGQGTLTGERRLSHWRHRSRAPTHKLSYLFHISLIVNLSFVYC